MDDDGDLSKKINAKMQGERSKFAKDQYKLKIKGEASIDPA
jgi:hypothetical protein